MFDVEPDLEVFANGLHRTIHLRQHLMFAFVKEPVPEDDFGIFDKRSPELDEITVARPFACERILHELVELKVAFVRAIEADAARARGFLVVFAKAGDARRRNALGVTGAKGVQERAVALVEEQDSVDVVGFAKVGGQAGPEGAHVRMEQTERSRGVAALQVNFRDLFHTRYIRTEHVFN